MPRLSDSYLDNVPCSLHPAYTAVDGCASETSNTVSAAKLKLNPEGPFPQHNIEMRRLAGAGMCYIQGGEYSVRIFHQAWLLFSFLHVGVDCCCQLFIPRCEGS